MRKWELQVKTREFKKHVEELDYTVWNIMDELAIDNGHQTIATVSKNDACRIDTNYSQFSLEPYKKQEGILALMVEYALTPIDERADEKRYALQHNYLGDENYNYLNICDDDNNQLLGNLSTFGSIKNTFTRKEMEKIKEKYDTDLEDYTEIEVEYLDD